MKYSRSGGFTLIELMVVVIIIAALAGMVLPKVLPASDEAKRHIATGDIANISMALKMYHLKNDRYPSNEEGLKVLFPDYIEKKARDPWKRDYLYRNPGTRNASGFDLWSQGKDPQGETDDVTNWSAD
jgi:general secretion pathway protein G